MTEETRGSKDNACEDAPYEPEDPAMLIFTSGTTGRPKGVVTRFLSLDAQVNDQRSMWGWTADDRVLNVLPLHHVHGVINMTAVPLYSGACVEYMVPDPTRIWQRFRMGAMVGPLSLFMAVPTIYAKLIQTYETFSPEEQRACSEAARDLRLMPMPSARVRIVDEESGKEISPESGESGELRITGDIVFKEYWNRPDATAEAFDEEGWFKTGDIAAYDPEKDSYRILGRASADIIKTGGYKVSANEIERELLDHPAIREIAVLGLPDEVYGERVAAIVVLRPDQPAPSDEDLRAWAKERIASYKAPSTWLFLDDEIPKNAMGKVAKKQLRRDLFNVE
ncbi:Malonate--CoA ligase [Hondaea fermentalgiana]|uniref:Malonate--CoA ligase n=1 Tax=Hondaea fermentalgiana TaxID=2315210 RepID=A0A2R5GCJ1_9STRA|nr:Malonate--CoA ligase [Hondaea fermentalgiana]|eukprot:GBG28275.1 Malonate--CoA ligase [Hondaea fermentalgiana]